MTAPEQLHSAQQGVPAQAAPRRGGVANCLSSGCLVVLTLALCLVGYYWYSLTTADDRAGEEARDDAARNARHVAASIKKSSLGPWSAEAQVVQALLPHHRIVGLTNAARDDALSLTALISGSAGLSSFPVGGEVRTEVCYTFQVRKSAVKFWQASGPRCARVTSQRRVTADLANQAKYIADDAVARARLDQSMNTVGSFERHIETIAGRHGSGFSERRRTSGTSVTGTVRVDTLYATRRVREFELFDMTFTNIGTPDIAISRITPTPRSRPPQI